MGQTVYVWEKNIEMQIANALLPAEGEEREVLTRILQK